MELHLDTAPSDSYHIRAYSDTFIQINDEKITHSLLVSAKTLYHPWRPRTVSDIQPQDWRPLFELQPTIVLLGTGRKFEWLDAALLAEFYQRNIGIEVMDTAAACRTYSLLLAEDRQVAAALLINPTSS
jgi:uncharacterized protein